MARRWLARRTARKPVGRVVRSQDSCHRAAGRLVQRSSRGPTAKPRPQRAERCRSRTRLPGRAGSTRRSAARRWIRRSRRRPGPRRGRRFAARSARGHAAPGRDTNTGSDNTAMLTGQGHAVHAVTSAARSAGEARATTPPAANSIVSSSDAIAAQRPWWRKRPAAEPRAREERERGEQGREGELQQEHRVSPRPRPNRAADRAAPATPPSPPAAAARRPARRRLARFVAGATDPGQRVDQRVGLHRLPEPARADALEAAVGAPDLTAELGSCRSRPRLATLQALQLSVEVGQPQAVGQGCPAKAGRWGLARRPPAPRRSSATSASSSSGRLISRARRTCAQAIDRLQPGDRMQPHGDRCAGR